MGDEYTPTTEEVWTWLAQDLLSGEVAEARGQFDRWLKGVKAEAWDECLDAIEKHELNTEQARTDNPYRASSGQTEGGR